MAATRRTKGISNRTSKLLGEGEGAQSDFKRSPDGVSTDDLVAFANSRTGGSLLVGIDERAGPGGAQVGHVIGCDVGDAAILQIVNKALSCFPPVAVEVLIENLTQLPFLRIDVPSSATKPHCTPKGVYCLREGSRNRPLQPSELLKIFLDSEARAFAKRFETAASRITQDISHLESNLNQSISNMGSKLGWAEMQLGDTESAINSILAHIQNLESETADLTTRLRAMFRQDDRSDPVRDRERKQILDLAVEQMLKDENLLKEIKGGQKLNANITGSKELTKEELKAVFQEALKIAVGRLEEDKQQRSDEQQN